MAKLHFLKRWIILGRPLIVEGTISYVSIVERKKKRIFGLYLPNVHHAGPSGKYLNIEHNT